MTKKRYLDKVDAEELGETLQDIYDSKFEQYENEELGLAVLYKYPEFRQFSYSYFLDYSELLYLCFLGFGLVGAGFFGPNLIYRTLLFIFTNDSWRKSK